MVLNYHLSKRYYVTFFNNNHLPHLVFENLFGRKWWSTWRKNIFGNLRSGGVSLMCLVPVACRPFTQDSVFSFFGWGPRLILFLCETLIRAGYPAMMCCVLNIRSNTQPPDQQYLFWWHLLGWACECSLEVPWILMESDLPIWNFRIKVGFLLKNGVSIEADTFPKWSISCVNDTELSC